MFLGVTAFLDQLIDGQSEQKLNVVRVSNVKANIQWGGWMSLFLIDYALVVR